jgi:hypothetical protein
MYNRYLRLLGRFKEDLKLVDRRREREGEHVPRELSFKTIERSDIHEFRNNQSPLMLSDIASSKKAYRGLPILFNGSNPI